MCKTNKLMEHYESLPTKAPKAPRTAFVENLAELCDVTITSVRAWIKGETTPSDANKAKIAEYMGCSVDELFN